MARQGRVLKEGGQGRPRAEGSGKGPPWAFPGAFCTSPITAGDTVHLLGECNEYF